MDSQYSVVSAHMARGALRLLRPYDVADRSKVRVGRAFDGGYVMVDAFDGVEAAYSFGINDDVSWDIDIAARDIDLFQYDHTIEALPVENSRFHWKKLGIARHSSEDMRSLPDLLRENGHVESRNLLLKCDIEGAEWGMLADASRSVLSQFSQVVLELHDIYRVGDEVYADMARQALTNLTNSHNVVHVHANNWGGHRIVGGIMVANVLELTLLRKDMGTFVPSASTFPTPMDMPCNRDWADIYLGTFTF